MFRVIQEYSWLTPCITFDLDSFLKVSWYVLTIAFILMYKHRWSLYWSRFNNAKRIKF